MAWSPEDEGATRIGVAGKEPAAAPPTGGFDPTSVGATRVGDYSPPEQKSSTPETDRAMAENPFPHVDISEPKSGWEKAGEIYTHRLLDIPRVEAGAPEKTPAWIDLQKMKSGVIPAQRPTEDKPLSAFEAASINTATGFVSGLTSLQGVTALFPPVAWAQLAWSAPGMIRRVMEAEKTPLYSQERWESGLAVVTAMLSLGLLSQAGANAARGLLAKRAAAKTAAAAQPTTPPPPTPKTATAAQPTTPPPPPPPPPGAEFTFKPGEPLPAPPGVGVPPVTEAPPASREVPGAPAKVKPVVSSKPGTPAGATVEHPVETADAAEARFHEAADRLTILYGEELPPEVVASLKKGGVPNWAELADALEAAEQKPISPQHLRDPVVSTEPGTPAGATVEHPVETADAAEARFHEAADRLAILHGEDYMPPEVVASLEKGGVPNWTELADSLEASERKIPQHLRDLSMEHNMPAARFAEADRIAQQLRGSFIKSSAGMERKPGQPQFNFPTFNVFPLREGGFRVEMPSRRGQQEIQDPHTFKLTGQYQTVESQPQTFFIEKEGGVLQDATRIKGAGKVPKLEIRPRVGEETPLWGEPKGAAGAQTQEEPVPTGKRPVAGTPQEPAAPRVLIKDVREGDTIKGVVVTDAGTGAELGRFVSKELHPTVGELADLRAEAQALANKRAAEFLKKTAEQATDAAREELRRRFEARRTPAVTAAVTRTPPGGAPPKPPPRPPEVPEEEEDFSTKKNFRKIANGQYEHIGPDKNPTGLLIRRNPDTGAWDVSHPDRGGVFDRVTEHQVRSRSTGELKTLKGRKAAMQKYKGGLPSEEAPPAARVPVRPPMPVRKPAPERQASMQDTIDETFRNLWHTGEIPAGSPGLGLTEAELIRGGREAIKNGVNPHEVARSDKIRDDLKYGVLRAKGEELRDEAARLHDLARADPTQANRDLAESSFQTFNDWNARYVVPARRSASYFLVGKGQTPLEPEYNVRNMVDLREQFIRLNRRDLDPKKGEVKRAEKLMSDFEKTQQTTMKNLDALSAELAREAPDPAYDFRDPQHIKELISKILKDTSPC